MKEDHFLLHVAAGRKGLCVQGQSSFQEMTCSQAPNGTAHKGLLQGRRGKEETNEPVLSCIN